MKNKTTVESISIITNGPPAVATPRMGDSALIVEVLQNHFGPDGGRMHTGVEVGVHRGATSALLLKTFPNLMLWMVDSYAAHKPDSDYRKSGDSLSKITSNEQHQHYLAARAATEFAASRRTFCKFPSLQAVKIIPTPKLSFAFLDGAHDLNSVRNDIMAWWPRVEAGGMLAGHDFNHPRDGKQFGVAQAVSEFAEFTGLHVQVLGTVWAVVKP